MALKFPFPVLPVGFLQVSFSPGYEQHCRCSLCIVRAKSVALESWKLAADVNGTIPLADIFIMVMDSYPGLATAGSSCLGGQDRGQ